MNQGLADPKRPFSHHIQEIRRRFYVVALSVFAWTSVGYYLREPIVRLVLQPINAPLYYSSPTGGFSFILNLSVYFGLVASLPVILYNVIGFLEPALGRSLRQQISSLVATSFLLVAAGVGFAYKVSLPTTLKVLEGFGSSQLQSLIFTEEYLHFITLYLAGFAIIFQLPLVLLVINYFHRIPVATLMRYQRWVILINFIVGAVINPAADPLNQALMALPGIVMYQVSILLIWLVNTGRSVPLLSFGKQLVRATAVGSLAILTLAAGMPKASAPNFTGKVAGVSTEIPAIPAVTWSDYSLAPLRLHLAIPADWSVRLPTEAGQVTLVDSKQPEHSLVISYAPAASPASQGLGTITSSTGLSLRLQGKEVSWQQDGLLYLAHLSLPASDLFPSTLEETILDKLSFAEPLPDPSWLTFTGTSSGLTLRYPATYLVESTGDPSKELSFLPTGADTAINSCPAGFTLKLDKPGPLAGGSQPLDWPELASPSVYPLSVGGYSGWLAIGPSAASGTGPLQSPLLYEAVLRSGSQEVYLSQCSVPGSGSEQDYYKALFSLKGPPA